ncbi:hypothetical protein Ade02nite_59920 [Paractinoplanes deccanensis]|uniref:N-acetyltransferase domain-containing protein n=1 Tax=Paractinoplanes deccanensis TaxID=113561 RepID=A0ABQ3YBK8_9ACTN|nr:GNAT family N-acetyltransferase [Actinoplanes deccanensis]GID77351.1 hypothetical protein Ade02nite_59920 [Actinoplanes deccanensis]
MTTADRAARAWLEATAVLAGLQPDGYFHETAHGSAELVTGAPSPQLNGVIGITRDPDAGELAELAASPRLGAVSWAVQVRGDDPGDRIERIAAAHGRKHRRAVPFLLKELSAADAHPVPGARRLTGADSPVYRRTMAAGFEAPEEALALLTAPAVLDLPSMTGYLLEAGGVPVATGFGVLHGDLVGVFNIAVPPPFRRRGHGRAATAAVLSDAYARGARTAFLRATPDGLPVYLRMGFHAAENWTVFS